MVISFTGHRDFEFQKGEESLHLALMRHLQEGCVEPPIFWSGMARGFDLVAAAALLELRSSGVELKLCCAIPYPTQQRELDTEDQRLYEKILSQADQIEIISPHYHPGVYHLRNDFLVDRADHLIAYYDETRRRSGTGYTVRKALKRGVAVDNIYPQQQLSLFDLV